MGAVGSALINAPLQWGADGGEEFDNRFNGFPSAEETIETVQFPNRSSGTPLKWGVNESTPVALIRRCARKRGVQQINVDRRSSQGCFKKSFPFG